MDVLIGSILFLLINGVFHQSAVERFDVVKVSGLGCPPAERVSASESLLTIAALVMSFVAGLAAFYMGTDGYKIYIWLPAALCWVISYRVFSCVVNPQIKLVMVYYGIPLIPFMFWLLVWRNY